MQEQKYQCHDCAKEIIIKGEEIVNGLFLSYKNEKGEKFQVLKCHECYKINPTLTNYKRCEVYSRVVGYMSPVEQWNIGKKQEYFDRKIFDITGLD
jgi:hypothetical protein